MQIQASRLTLQLENPFKLSYGATTFRENVRVTISDGVYTGTGEAAVVPYYGETPDRVLAYLTDPALADALGDDPLLLDDMLNCLPPSAVIRCARRRRYGPARSVGAASRPAALSAVGTESGANPREFVHRGDGRRRSPTTGRICAPPARYGLIKLKLGSGDWRTDLAHGRNRARRDQPRRCAWMRTAAGRLRTRWSIVPRLAEIGVLFIEQPVARDDLEGWRALPSALPAHHPPLIADESVQGVESVLPLAGIADGINIKLAKCGGLRAARQMIMLARALGLKVLIGCMIESSIAVTAAAHLAPLADFVDLDGNVLITNDPFCGAG